MHFLENVIINTFYLNTSTTRNGSILLLVLCNDNKFVFNTSFEAPFGSIDHAIVEFNVSRNQETHEYEMCSFDFNSTFKQRICTVITKAHQRVVIFSRVCFKILKHCSQNFTTYIHPILEYNSNVWNPSKKYLIDQLENGFTKRVTSLENYSYLELLGILGL